MISIKTFCLSNSLPWSDEIEEKLDIYVQLLLKFNKTMNLIGPMSEQEIKEKLFIDSLVAAIAEPPKGRLLDVGSGAGLPGIVLAIFYPEVHLSVVEPRRKRADFLSLALRTLGINDAAVFQKRVEMLDLKDYDYVIAKAFRKPVQWLAMAQKWMAKDGVVLCMHTDESDMETSLVLKKKIRHLDLDLRISKKNREVSVFTIQDDAKADLLESAL